MEDLLHDDLLTLSDDEDVMDEDDNMDLDIDSDSE